MQIPKSVFLRNKLFQDSCDKLISSHSLTLYIQLDAVLILYNEFEPNSLRCRRKFTRKYRLRISTQILVWDPQRTTEICVSI